MTNRDLLALVRAKKQPGKGRRARIVVSAACRAWAKDNQTRLAAAFRNAAAEIFLDEFLVGVKDPRALGFTQILVNADRGTRVWTHNRGDEFGLRVLVGLEAGAADRLAEQQQAWDIERARAALPRTS